MADALTTEYVKRPQRYHLMLSVLYLLAILQALWQHGQPIFVCCVLAFAIVAPFFAYLHDSLFPLHHRRLAQAVTAALAFLWVGARIANKIPADLALIEGLAAMGLAFAFSRKAEEFDFQLLTAVIMIGYGAVAPPRTIYLLVMPASVGLILACLYRSRVYALARRPFGLPKRLQLGRNWQAIALHVVIFLIVWSIIFILFPTSKHQGVGLIGSSFDTDNRNALAPRLQNWLPSARLATAPDGAFTTEGAKPTQSDPDAETLISGDWRNPGGANGSGGSGPPSDDVVMRVKSPARLYWLGRIYERYDGRRWSSYRPGREQKVAAGTFPTVIPQTFVIEKWVSRSIFAAYRPAGYGVPLRKRHTLPSEINEWGRRFADDQPLPPLPFQYTVRSYVHPHPGRDSPVGITGGSLAPSARAHSRRLPKRISKRVRNLALTITADLDDPFAKANALRDYLRTTFQYEQFSSKPPANREAVDYFLFELDRGHCEYFAAALAILARAADLPARVATGFSPGDYNTLTGCFEVKESHAHAWTQIFVPDHGWLTFDATPPGSITSRATPGFIGTMRDPFADDWQINPPELSRDVIDFAKRSAGHTTIPAAGKKAQPLKLSAMSQVAMNVPTSVAEAKSIWRRWTRKTTDADGNPTTRLASAWQTITTNLKTMLERAARLAQLAADAVTGYRLLLAACASAVIWLSIAICRRLHAVISRRRRLRRCRDWWQVARDSHEESPSTSIQYSYRVVRELLTLVGMPKRPGDDLFDYGRAIGDRFPAVSHDALAVFDLYALVRYGEQAPTSREARAALMRASCARDLLLEQLVSKG